MIRRQILVCLLAIPLVFAVRPRYGGEITVRLNEPVSTALNTANYSNLIFYSLIYENFFYLTASGEIGSHIFDEFYYNASSHILTLSLRGNLSFSNGGAVTVQHVQNSLNVFLSLNLLNVSRLTKLIKSITAKGNEVYIELNYDVPDVLNLLTVPELVLVDESGREFSGPFYPAEWPKNQYVLLKANPFYAGGRTFLDAIRVVFQDTPNCDIFLGVPGIGGKDYTEHQAGVYQNAYLCFPKPDISQNTRLAMYSLLRQFQQTLGPRYQVLTALTAADESPVTLQIKLLPQAKIKSLLRFADVKLYLLSSLDEIEKSLVKFFQDSGINITVSLIDDAQLSNFMATSPAQFVLMGKLFQKKTPIGEKISRIVRESTFDQFSDKYLLMLAELDEMKAVQNDTYYMNQIAKISEKIADDGFILPLYKKTFSLYINKRIQAVTVDAVGRPNLGQANVSN
jgi:MarR-like DNA-binding transcriptional regulator SgrR of sgrS sRNA